MAINKIEIKNFTVFNDITIWTSGGINVFIGENGTGKTHLLKILNQEYTYPKTDINVSSSLAPSALYSTMSSMDSDEMEDSNVYINWEHSMTTLPAVFIPAKEMLSMSNIVRIDDKYSKSLKIDRTLIDIIKKAQNIIPNTPSSIAKKVAGKLESIMDGTVFIHPEHQTFWVRKGDGLEIPFSMEAEGFRKFGLLWQLIMNESISEGTILLWDEPEANINPKLIPALVDVILELSRNGVQVFIATHDYFLPKYIEVLSKESDSIAFHSLHKTDEGVKCETSNKFSNLDHNGIIDEIARLYEREIEKVTG
ncbi:MAG: AAA family ATPase [Defluviitaleaceae bacterium]|nr:AAA family ATPase [Defluviitaleaceae bacterium]